MEANRIASVPILGGRMERLYIATRYYLEPIATSYYFEQVSLFFLHTSNGVIGVIDRLKLWNHQFRQINYKFSKI